MLALWLVLKRWLRNLLSDLSAGATIDWWTKLSELTAIVSRWIDQRSPPPEETPEEKVKESRLAKLREALRERRRARRRAG